MCRFVSMQRVRCEEAETVRGQKDWPGAEVCALLDEFIGS